MTRAEELLKQHAHAKRALTVALASASKGDRETVRDAHIAWIEAIEREYRALPRRSKRGAA